MSRILPQPGLANPGLELVSPAVGASVTDLATLTETPAAGQVTGEVDFSVCFTAAAAACTTGGADAGQNKAVAPAGGNSGTATSNAVQLTQAGFYCFRADYDSLSSTAYQDTTHSNASTECVQAVPPAPTIEVTKTAVPTTVPEPEGSLTFNVAVHNTSTETVTLTTLTDDVYGNLDGQGTCDVTPGAVLAADATYNCSFSGAFTGDATDDQTDVVTATAVDSDANQATDTDDATVSLHRRPADDHRRQDGQPDRSSTSPAVGVGFSVVVTNN